MPELSPVYQIADDYVEAFAALHPVAATSIGVAGHDAKMTDFSPEGQARFEALRKDALAALAAAPVTSERDCSHGGREPKFKPATRSFASENPRGRRRTSLL